MACSVHVSQSSKCGDALFRGCFVHSADVECVLEIEREAVALTTRSVGSFTSDTGTVIVEVCERRWESIVFRRV